MESAKEKVRKIIKVELNRILNENEGDKCDTQN